MVWPCIIVGCTHSPKTIQPPPNFPDPPNSIVCLECGNRTNAIYRRDDFYFSFCFLNCCRLQKGQPYLSCGVCHASFGEFGTGVCTGCETAYPSQFLCCPHCGRKNEI